MGMVQGMTVDQCAKLDPEKYKKWQEDPIANRPPGGERFEDVIKRCGDFYDRIRQTHPVGKIAIALHAGSLSGLICAVFNLPVRFFLSVEARNCSLSIIETGNIPVLRLLNDTSHIGRTPS